MAASPKRAARQAPARKQAKARPPAKPPARKTPARKPAKRGKPAAKPATRRKPAAKRSTTVASAQAAPREEAEEAQTPQETWILVPDAPVPQPRLALAGAARPFDPATGDWLPAPTAVPAPTAAMGSPSVATGPAAAQPAAEPAPDAPKRTAGSIAWTVILAIDLGFLALNFLAQLVVGGILLFAPESATADDLRNAFGVGSPRALAVQQSLTFVLMGVIPFAWVLATRRVTWEGTKRYLRLHDPLRGILRGVALTPLLILAVFLLIAAYTLATQGPDALSLTESEEGQNPAVDAILEQLNWPLVVLIAVTAGVGEEILFRGVLQKWVGVWGQAALFGLAHSAGGFLPQILFAFGLGVLFGYLLKRGWSLWTLMTAHFLYDFVLLAIALVYG